MGVIIMVNPFKFAKLGDEVVVGAGKSIEEVAESLGVQLNKTGSIRLPSGKRVRGADGKLIPTSNNTYQTWDSSWEVVDNSTLVSVKGADNVTLGKSKFNFPITPTSSYNFGVFLVVGGIAWNILSIVGSFSQGFQETINSFFGLNCEPNDIECQEKGARNQLLLGVAIAGVGVLSLASFLGLGKKKEQGSAEA